MMPFMPTAQLPRMMRDLVDRLGFPAASRLVETLGGTTIPVPMRQNREGRARFAALCEDLGAELATALCREYGGTDVYIPLCRQALLDQRNASLNRERDVLAKEGTTEREIVARLAQRYSLSDRNVWRILKKSIPDSVVTETQPEQSRQAHLWKF